jgi:uncharacterized lipoprotein YbaY
MSNSHWLALGGSVALGCAAATSPGRNAKPAVVVRLVASDGSSLPPGSSVELTLADVTLSEAPPMLLSQVTYSEFPQH